MAQIDLHATYVVARTELELNNRLILEEYSDSISPNRLIYKGDTDDIGISLSMHFGLRKIRFVIHDKKKEVLDDFEINLKALEDKPDAYITAIDALKESWGVSAEERKPLRDLRHESRNHMAGEIDRVLGDHNITTACEKMPSDFSCDLIDIWFAQIALCERLYNTKAKPGISFDRFVIQ